MIFMKYDLFIPRTAPLPGVRWEMQFLKFKVAEKNFTPPLETNFHHQLAVEHPL